MLNLNCELLISSQVGSVVIGTDSTGGESKKKKKFKLFIY
jgi:hypothetical protein